KAVVARARERLTSLQPEPGPLDLRRLPTMPTIPPSTAVWQVVRGEAREDKGLLSVHNDGAPYWITAKDDLPESFQLVLNCQVEFLKGRQVIYPAQQTIFRTLCVRFGADDVTQDIMEHSGTLLQLSQDALLLWRE